MKLPYGYWLSNIGKLVPVKAAGGHADVAIDLLGEKFAYVLEMGWVRIVCDKTKQTIYYEHGNHVRPSPEQMRKLKELAQEAGFKLICENTGREVDIYKTKVSKRADKLLEAPPSGKRTWRSRYPVEPSEGAYFYVRYPLGWDLYAVRALDRGFIGHSTLWEELVCPDLAKQWSKTLKVPAKALERELKLHVYGFPRGRVSKGSGRSWLVLHGGDASGLSKVKVECAFQIGKRAKWERDSHEQCQAADRDAVREILKIKETWPAVGLDYGWDD